MAETDDDNQKWRERQHKAERKRKRVNIIAVAVFSIATSLAGFIIGERTNTEPPPSPPAAIYVVESHQEIRGVSDALKDYLRKAAFKSISVEEATKEICRLLKIETTDTAQVEQVSHVVQRTVDVESVSIGDALDALTQLLKARARPSPSPVPTATIVYPRQ